MPPPTLPQQLQAARQAHGSGRFPEAEKLFRQILAIDPNHPEALYNLATLMIQARRLDDAVALLRQFIELQPEFANAWNDLSVALRETLHWEEAAAAANRAIQCNPQLALAHFNLGSALRVQEKFEDAIAAYTQAITLDPKLAEAHNTLSALFRNAHRLPQAAQAARNAIAANENHAQAYVNLGVALEEMGQVEEAIATMQRAIQLQPTLVEAYFNLGNFLRKQRHFADALAAYHRALESKPHGAAAVRNNLAGVLRDLGRLDEAMELYQQAIAETPGEASYHSSLICLLQYHQSSDAARVLDECRQWDRWCAQPLKRLIPQHNNPRDPHRRLRIGYVSPDFRNHVVGRNILPLLANHDHAQFEIHCFSNHNQPDAMTAKFRAAADKWHDVARLSDDHLANLILAEQIDILVDLALHTGGNRLLTFARKPAPIQITFAGYPGTTGLSTIDYRLTDPFLDPPGIGDDNYTEKSVRLPDSFWCYEPDDDLPVQDPPAATNNCITFGCLNNFCKTNPDVLQLWSQVLKSVPDSRLLMMCPPDARKQTLEIFHRHDLSADRIEFVSFQSRPKYLQTYQRIDIVLDTFPYNGHTTSLDAMWMGVPVVNLLGKTVVGRAGFSQLSNLKLTELVAQNPTDFLRIARELALDPDRLRQLRHTLRQRMMQSPVMDARRFARNIETAYRSLWTTWGTAPRESLSPDRIMPQANIAQQIQAAAKEHRAGRWSQAEQLYLEILALEPNHADVLHRLGMLMMQLHRPESAVEFLKRSVAIRPDAPRAWNDLSVALAAMQMWEKAMAAAQRAIEFNPNLPAAHFNLANALRRLGQPDMAIASYTTALTLDPRQFITHNILSALYRAAGKLEQAVSAAQKAIALNDNFADAHLNLGLALGDLDRVDDAITQMRRTIQLEPTLAEPYFNLGNYLKGQHRFGEAVIAYMRAIELKPEGASGVNNNLADALKSLGRLDQAVETYRKAIALAPDEPLPYSNLVYLMLFHPGYDSARLLQECRQWDHEHALRFRSHIPPHENEPNPTRRLRIGYVSPDFRFHVVGRNMLPLFTHHDHTQFEIHCFSNLTHPDPMTEKFRKTADKWHDIASINDDDLTRLIRAEKIDILVDLTLHMAGNCLLTFARKPAPVQVTFAGYPGTTGVATIDYRLTDPYLDPPGIGDENYSEQSIRLPHSFWCYDSPGDLPVNELPARGGKPITFGCLNNFCKINEDVIRLWASVLKEIRHSRLLLMCPAESPRHLLETFQRHRLSPDRFEFVPFQPYELYLQTYHRVDIMLDTVPYNGHTTSLDALWMGVPVISLLGKTVVGRAGISQLSNLGLTELLAFDPEQYVRLARDLATDRDRLTHLRRTLRQRMIQSPLMDAQAFARNIEAAYREMWKKWCD